MTEINVKYACEGKNKYPNESIAAKAARGINKASGSSVKPYFCNNCKNWHVGTESTSLKKWKTRKKARRRKSIKQQRQKKWR